ncbi:MAG: hypothetical protein ACI9OJ_003774 [Myxococcota bacterium]|jgi:hypothetical protein
MLLKRLVLSLVVAVVTTALVGCPGDDEAGASVSDTGSGELDGNTAVLDTGADPDQGSPVDTGDQPDTESDVDTGAFPTWIGEICADSANCPDAPGFESWCVQGAQGENICTIGCIEECPVGFGCVAVQNAGQDGLLLCMPNKPTNCNTCEDDTDCVYSGAKCMAIGSNNGEDDMRCAMDCSAGATVCGDGYDCVKQDEGSELCLPETDSCLCFGEVDGTSRVCERAVEGVGTCSGTEICDGADGWGGCTAATPIAEDCNGADDNCDGQTDEDVPLDTCDVSNDHGTCTGNEVCSGESGVECDASVPAAELCDGIDNNCDGDTDEGQPNNDGDDECDALDTDDDNDEEPDETDNCPFAANPDQVDTDMDGDGDACDGDKDNDTIADEVDNCPTVPNSNPATDLDSAGKQKDFDNDGLGDACDPDKDGDGSLPPQDCDDFDATVGKGFAELCDGQDNNCDGTPDEGFADADADELKDCVDPNDDNDIDLDVVDCAPLDPAINSGATEVCDGVDNNCSGATDDGDPEVDAGFSDTDDDGDKDCVDDDIDGDGVLNDAPDNCVLTQNPDQVNSDDDPFGDACDTDDDNDGVFDDVDNCPVDANEDQTDLDGDDLGDACDSDPDGDNQEAPLDCKPFDPLVYDGAPELCDGKDNDCNGPVDDGFPDNDNDSLADCVDSDIDGDGELNETDCEPENGSIFPNQTETCDGFDNNCNEAIDEGCPATDVRLIFPSAVVSGTSASGLQVRLSVGMPGVIGASKPTVPDAFGVDWGFYQTLD